MSERTKQLRQNSEPNMWEAVGSSSATLTRFTITGSRSNLMVLNWERRIAIVGVDPTGGQIILYTGPLPTLKISQWSQWTIEAIDNNIIVSIDGNQIITFKDKNMSKELSNGEIAMYTEDAKVSFDNMYISQLK